MPMVTCPMCNLKTTEWTVNEHLDKGCPQTRSQTSVTATPQKSIKDPSSPEEIQTVQVKRQNEDSNNNNNNGNNNDHIRKKARNESGKPMADQIRPKTLDDFIGQEDLVGPKGILRTFIERDSCPSMILWGPSGVGKTSLARIIAQKTKSRFVEMSAAVHSTNDIKKIFEEAKNDKKLLNRKTILFLDELHRFNKLQQDAFLPHVEKGDITLIGATTENPSFKINGALISRTRVFVLKKLTQSDLESILKRAINIVNENRQVDDHMEYEISDDCIKYLSSLADGDGRIAINILEISLNSMNGTKMDLEYIKNALKRTHMLYDRVGDSHYDTISAFHKSVRGSDPDATLFYLGRMLQSGEDPLFIARRMVRIASEDVGLVDDSCLPFATSTYTAVQQIGMPEADCILAHCAVKLAKAPKSVQLYRAYNNVKALFDNEPGAAAASVPIHLRNAPTKLMKEIGYGKEYKYNPDFIDGKVVQDYMPEGFENVKFLDERHLGNMYDKDLDGV